MSTDLINLPLEIRQQIFGEYFKVPGGYVYDGKSDKLRNADNTPIDLSLIYACRSISNDCKHLPLAVNTLHFSTLYPTYYNVLQQDLVIHLAPLISAEMHTELAKEFPGFKAKLEAEREFHFHIWRTGDDQGFAGAGENARPDPCQFVQHFYENNVADIGKKSPLEYHGYRDVDSTTPHSPDDLGLDDSDFGYQRWDSASAEVDRCLTRCLRLIADQSPTEFGNRVYTSLPHWVNRYPVEEFFNLRFDDWAIPTRSRLEYVLNLLGIPEFVWKLPDMWSYNLAFHHAVGGNPSAGQFSEQYDHPTFDFTFRTREKIRFSAIAVAIRFLGLLPSHQRTQVRTLDLHEDLLSVNKASFHGCGLVPLLKENPLLRVQRRVNIVNCIMDALGSTTRIDYVLMNPSYPCYVDEMVLIPELSRWLLDSLWVANAGISAGWFTLFLESGSYANHCTEVFDKLVHTEISLNQAWNECLGSGLLEGLSVVQVKEVTRWHALEEGFQDSIMQLVHQTSSVLRCDFNPGLPKNPEMVVQEMKAHPEGVWEYWQGRRYLGELRLPDHLHERESLALICDIQSQEEYLESQR
ncbi:hypothetical protein NW768_000878 [Fusarium equiseti]|uniref:Uncharacterized protein n=1 Tax=Fusarium equiseti TaxID=61235 RepID=A0ABQ8RUK2_FUSEQ|nr:hypothetical protein NW768_000878 [Fusarium equiseti]